QRIDCKCDEPAGHKAEEYGAVRLVHELRQGTVETDSLAWVVVDRSLDEEDADEPEDDRACEVTDDRNPGVPAPGRPAHLLGLRILEKVGRDTTIGLVERNADNDGTGDSHQPHACGPAQYAAGRLGRTPR